MSLRRSPRRTPAFLAANRANAQKSTGPRTSTGKQRSAANAFRNGNRTTPAFWTHGLSHRELAEYYALRDAIDRALCPGSQGQKLVSVVTDMVWSVRRCAERHLRTLSPEKRRRLENRFARVARCWHRAIPRPGWKVTVTVLARHGRCRRCDLMSIPTLRRALGPMRTAEPRPARVHVIAKVTCTGHPLFNRGPEGVPLSTKPGAKPPEIRTKPEYGGKEVNYANVSPNPDCPNASPARPDPLRVMGSRTAAPRRLWRTRRREAARGIQQAQGTRRLISETRGADDSAPPWEIPEGYSWPGKEGKG